MEVKENDLLIPLECNLASLQSISTFVQNVASTLDGKKIDVVALNAGVARNVASKDVLRTAEGFELTVGTNHFGHFYLANLLLPLVSRIKIRH
jgi:protochlorophyllide reductase